MLAHAGYFWEENAPPPDTPFSVLSCGHYRLLHQPEFHTERPHGRPDYQLLYVAAGRAKFMLNGEAVWVPEGHTVLYRPGEPQQYVYYQADHPDIYWIHFSGRDVDALLSHFGMDKPLCRVQVRGRYAEIMDRILREIQLQRPFAQEQAAALFRELLIAFSRGHLATDETVIPRSSVVEQAVQYFHAHYHEPIVLSEYARSQGAGLCWFSRLFRRQMGVSPQQYLIELRMVRARNLLSSTDYPVGEIARLTGYDNPLYFSRLFTRQCGCSPRDYRKQQQT